MSRQKLLLLVLIVLVVGVGGYWYANDQGRVSEVPTEEMATTTVADTVLPGEGIEENVAARAVFSHPNDGYSFTYNGETLEARVSTASELAHDTGFRPSAAVTTDGGYGLAVDILTFAGTLDEAQSAFMAAYGKNYDPQVIRNENLTINGNNGRVVTYKLSVSDPENDVYLIAHGAQTIIVLGSREIAFSIQTR